MPKPTVVNSSQGTVLRHGVGSGPVVYTDITNIVSLEAPDREIGTRNVNNLASTADVYAPTIFKGGKVSGQIQYDPQSDPQVILEGLITTPSVTHWQIHFPDAVNGATNATFDGILTKLKANAGGVEENLVADFEITVSGTVTLAVGV